MNHFSQSRIHIITSIQITQHLKRQVPRAVRRRHPVYAEVIFQVIRDDLDFLAVKRYEVEAAVQEFNVAAAMIGSPADFTDQRRFFFRLPGEKICENLDHLRKKYCETASYV